MKVEELIAMLQADGWETVPDAAAGCTILKHGARAAVVTIAARPSDGLGSAAAQSILKMAGMRPKA